MPKVNTRKMYPQFNDFSFLVQGSITKNGKIDPEMIKYLFRMRKQYPLNDILVSCWEVSNNDEFYLRKLSTKYNIDFLFNKDPGCFSKNYRGVNYNCNLNRMIVSTRNGILKSKSEYIIKLRSDSFFASDKIHAYLNEYYKSISNSLLRDSAYSIFEERIINCNLFARNPRSYLPYLFHPGDIMLIGKKGDLFKLFDVELADENIFQSYRRTYFFTMMKLVPEQYLWVNCINKSRIYNVYESNEEFTEKKIIESEKFYVNNFYVLEPNDVDFIWPKHNELYQSKGKYSVYDSVDWYNLYKKYILLSGEREIKKRIFRSLVISFMKLYFFIRTNLMRVPFLRKLAIKFFNKRN